MIIDAPGVGVMKQIILTMNQLRICALPVRTLFCHALLRLVVQNILMNARRCRCALAAHRLKTAKTKARGQKSHSKSLTTTMTI